MDMEREAGGSCRRAEIDTRAPFRSVKEAVVLFGEKVLAGEVYASKINEIRAAASTKENGGSRLCSLMQELEETKQSLEYVQEERLTMATSITSLKAELEKTKLELAQLKTRESERQVVISEIEDVKFVEKSTEFVLASPEAGSWPEFQRRRCVRFADPPPLAHVLNIQGSMLERQYSVSVDEKATPAKKSKKSLRGFMRAALLKKKDAHD